MLTNKPGQEDIRPTEYARRRRNKEYKDCLICSRKCANMAFAGVALPLCSVACVEAYKHKYVSPRVTFFVDLKDSKDPAFFQPQTEHGLKLFYDAKDGWCIKGAGVKNLALGQQLKSHYPYKLFTKDGHYEVIIIITGTNTCLHGNSRRSS